MSAIDGEKIEKQSEREHLWYDDHIKVELAQFPQCIHLNYSSLGRTQQTADAS